MHGRAIHPYLVRCLAVSPATQVQAHFSGTSVQDFGTAADDSLQLRAHPQDKEEDKAKAPQRRATPRDSHDHRTTPATVPREFGEWPDREALLAAAREAGIRIVPYDQYSTNIITVFGKVESMPRVTQVGRSLYGCESTLVVFQGPRDFLRCAPTLHMS
jgi:hypothetical protein